MKINLHFRARPQFLAYLQRKQRWACVVAHRRAGKTVACIMDLIAAAAQHKGREPRFGYVAPTFAQAKDVAWSYLKEYTAEIPGIEKSESELAVTLPHNGARIRLYGAENSNRLRGIYLDGVIIDEAGDIDPRAWPEVIRPALSDRRGWATFIGTPKGRNGFFKIFADAQADEHWFCQRLKASATGLIDAEELRDARRAMTPEQYRQEYECSFDASLLGTYFAQDVEAAETESRICRVAHDRSADVFASWDLGIGDATAIWLFQLVGQEWHWLRYYENSGKGLDHYVDWIRALPHPVHRHLLPHDAAARELQTGKSRLDFLQGRGLTCDIVPRHGVDDGINAARLRFNRMWFDAGNCRRGLECLRMYRAEFDHRHLVLKNKPLHDWTSHGADAFRTGVMGADDRKSVPHDLELETDWVV